MMWTYNYTYRNELYHHGVLGMKWGVRKQPRTPWQFRRALNKQDTIMVRAAYKADKYAKKERYYADKAERMAKKGYEEERAKGILKKNSKYRYKPKTNSYSMAGNTKAARKMYKSYNYGLKREKAEYQRHKAYKRTKELLRDAKNKGYTVNSKEVKRLANPGEYYVASLIGGSILANIAVAKYRNGNSYKVKKQK